MKKLFYIVFCAAFAALFCTSCANYRLAGTPTRLPFSSVYVKPVRNVSYAPQAAALLTNEIGSAIMKTPDMHLANEGDAQAILETEIVDYIRDPIATNSRDTALAASYRITAIAVCTLKKHGGETIFKDRKVRASTLIYLGTNANNVLIGDEYQNMPVLMRELGIRIKDAILGIW